MTDKPGDWILRVEGVNFNDTIFNTNDLSTIRGASLTLEAVGYELDYWLQLNHPAINFERIYIGGSQAVFKLFSLTHGAVKALADAVRAYLRAAINHGSDWPPYVGPDDLDRFAELAPVDQLRYLKTPSEHMVFVIDAERISDPSPDPQSALKMTINKAHQRSRRRQMRAPNLPRSPGAGAVSGAIADRALLRCPIDPDRQIYDDRADKNCTVVVGRDQFKKAVEYNNPGTGLPDADLSKGLKRVHVSKRVADLRPYGRDARRTLYPVQIGQGTYRKLYGKGLFKTHDFARSFEDIIQDPPDGLPVSLKGKLAYLYLDGNSFSKIRDASDFSRFSAMCEAVSKAMLTGLLERYLDKSPAGAVDPAYCIEKLVRLRTERDVWKIQYRQLMRVETLIFGGEDACLVTPAWLAFEIASLLLTRAQEEGTRQAVNLASGIMPSYRAGVLICDAHTPARRAVAVAGALCEDAKNAYGDQEPRPSISFHISESQDLPEVAGNTEDMMTALRGAQFRGNGCDQKSTNRAFRALYDGWKAQVTRIVALKKSLARSQLYAIIQELESHPADGLDARHRRFDALISTYVKRSRVGFDGEKIRQRLPCDHETPLVLRLKILAELWDYIDPLGRNDQTPEGAS